MKKQSRLRKKFSRSKQILTHEKTMNEHTRCLLRYMCFRVEYTERPHEFLEIDDSVPFEIEQIEDLSQ